MLSLIESKEANDVEAVSRELAALPAGIFARNQAHVSRHFPSPRKTSDLAQRQHRRQAHHRFTA